MGQAVHRRVGLRLSATDPSFSPMVGSPLSPHDLAITFWAVGVATAVRPEAAAAAFADGRALSSSLEGGRGAGVKDRSLADSSPSEGGPDATFGAKYCRCTPDYAFPAMNTCSLEGNV